MIQLPMCTQLCSPHTTCSTHNCFIHKQLPFTLSALCGILQAYTGCCRRFSSEVTATGMRISPSPLQPPKCQAFILRGLVYIREIQNFVSFLSPHTVEGRAPRGGRGHTAGDHFFLHMANQSPLAFFPFLPLFPYFPPKSLSL